MKHRSLVGASVLAMALGIVPTVGQAFAAAAPKIGQACTAAEWGKTNAGLMCVSTAPSKYVWAAYPVAPSTTAPKATGPKADVTTGTCTDSGYGLAKFKLVVVNHSSKRSDYVIDVTFYDAEGVQIGTGTAYIENLAPGATARDEATGSLADDAELSRCIVTNVRRSASY